MTRKGFIRAVFCGCSTLRVGVHAQGTGHVEEHQATWSHKHIYKHSPRTLPFPVLQPHEIFRLLDAAHPLLSPSASTLPLHHLWLHPPFLLDAEKEKANPVKKQTLDGQEEDLSLPCGQGA